MDLAVDARALHARGDIDAAVALLESELDLFPLHVGNTSLVIAEMLAAAGRGGAAMDALERALARGCRYQREWLLANAQLASLAADPRFMAIVDRAQRGYDAAAAGAKAHLMFAMPDAPPDAFGYPLLMVLHGNGSNAQATAPYWSTMADRGWVVAVPQSSEIASSPDAYTWNDRERAAGELDVHFDRVKRATEIDTGRIVLAGFSMGGHQALALALTKRFTARGVIAVNPWLLSATPLTTLVEAGAVKMLRAYIVVGADDPSRDAARALVDAMTAHSIRAQLDERPGLRHVYPDDMETTLAAALAFATK